MTGQEEKQTVDVSNLTEDQIKEIETSEEFVLNFKDEDYADPDKVEELRKHLATTKTTIHQKRHFRDKVKELEGKGKNPDPANPQATPTVDAQKQATEDAKKGVDPSVALTFRVDHPELSKDAANEVIRHAGAYNVTPEEALESPVIKSYLATIKTKTEVEDASIPPGNNPSATGLEKRDWSNATPQEIEAQRHKIMTGGTS